MKCRRCHTLARYEARPGWAELGRRPYSAASSARVWLPSSGSASTPGSGAGTPPGTRAPRAVSRPRSLMSVDFMSMASASAHFRVSRKIVRREFGSYLLAVPILLVIRTGRPCLVSISEMGRVVEGAEDGGAVGVPVDLAEGGHVQVHPVW